MDPFIGEVRLFAGNYAPEGWHLCNGDLLSIAENDALFSLIGTLYGGDGRTTFALPDLRGRVPVSQGTGPGLTPRQAGQPFGTETVTLTNAQMPGHNHLFEASKAGGTASSPTGQVFAVSTGDRFYAPPPQQGAQPQALNEETVANTGGGQPHGNIMPSTAINYIISLAGVYPSRN